DGPGPAQARARPLGPLRRVRGPLPGNVPTLAVMIQEIAAGPWRDGRRPPRRGPAAIPRPILGGRMLPIPPPPRHEATRRIFEAAGTPTDLATQMADFLVESNLAGHDSHGVIRIPAYVRMIREGGMVPAARPEVIQETPGSALVDGKYGFGHVAAA